jgi:3-oxoadipate enol-lactonase
MPKVAANGIEIAYEVLGQDWGQGLRGAPRPLVLTHGFASASAFWRPDIEPLAAERPVLVYDVRGHGATTVPPEAESYSMPAFAADLAGLLEALGIESAHIGGISMGGMIVAQFAADFPGLCASVMLIDTTCGNAVDGGPGGDWERRLANGIGALQHIASTAGLRETVAREWAYREANDPHIDVTPYSIEEDLRRIDAMTLPGYLGAAHAILTRPDLTNRVTSITAPALVMVGEWDDFRPCAERDHALIPGSRLVVRRECGHGSRWHVETFRAEVNAFLADVAAGRPVAGERCV